MINWNQYKPEEFQYEGKWIRNWFSNFTLVPIELNNIVWPSVENYYQAVKTLDRNEQQKFITCTPAEAKKLGRKIEIRKDWEQVKYRFMRKAVRQKFFSNKEQKRMLLQDPNIVFVEWNNWGDKIWGVDYKTGFGNNALGIILTEIKIELLYINLTK